MGPHRTGSGRGRNVKKSLAVIAGFVLALSSVALAQVRTPNQTSAWVNCTTTTGTLLAAQTDNVNTEKRSAVMFQTTSSTAVYITEGTGDPFADGNIRLVQGVTFNNEVGTVYTGAYSCRTASGTVSVNVVTRP